MKLGVDIPSDTSDGDIDDKGIIIIDDEEFYPLKRNSKYVISKSGIVYLKNRKIKQRINHKHIEILIDKKNNLYSYFIV